MTIRELKAIIKDLPDEMQFLGINSVGDHVEPLVFRIEPEDDVYYEDNEEKDFLAISLD